MYPMDALGSQDKPLNVLATQLASLQRPLFEQSAPFLPSDEWELLSQHLALPSHNRASFSLLPRLTEWSFIHAGQPIVWLRLLLLHLALGERVEPYALKYAEKFRAAYTEGAVLEQELLPILRDSAATALRVAQERYYKGVLKPLPPVYALHDATGTEPVDLTAELARNIASSARDNFRGSSSFMKAYQRLLVVETNQVEGIFELDNVSINHIVRYGFLANIVPSVPRRRQFDAADVPKILSDARHAFLYVAAMVRNPHFPILPTHIEVLHMLLVANCRVAFPSDGFPSGGGYEPSQANHFVPLGFRIHNVAVGERIGHPPAALATSMTDFCHILNGYMIELRDTGTMTSPFLKAAHLQHLFSAIHPFADGNGRVSRLIASQPLLAAGFPPIMVKSERKSEYYTALREADVNRYLSPLAQILAQHALSAVADIVSLSSQHNNLQTSEPMTLPAYSSPFNFPSIDPDVSMTDPASRPLFVGNSP